MDHFAGLDVSVKATSVCIVDDVGKIVREVKVASEPEALLAVLKNPAYHFKRIGLEAGPLSQWLFSALAEAGLPVICVETRHMRAVLKAQINKTDRNDARGMAQMRILVVEDQEDNRQIIRDMLSATDYEITEAESGEAALAVVPIKRNGILPAPGAPRRLEAPGEAHADYWLANGYHTAYVMGLLCAAALHPDRAPPAALPLRVTAARGAADAMLRFLDGDGRSPDWRQDLDRLQPLEREALAGFLFNTALRRKVSRREFDSVRELLRVGYALGLADMPAASQTAEMLERLATFEAITGKSSAEAEQEPLLTATEQRR